MTAPPGSRAARACGRIALALLAMFGLAGCSDQLQPGAAATVNGTRISQDDVDELVEAICEFSEVRREQAGGGEQQRLDELRSSLTSGLISFEIIEDAANEREVTATPAAVQASLLELAGPDPIPAGVSEETSDTLTQYFEDFALSLARQAAIGANAKDPDVTSVSEVTEQDLQAAAPVLAKATREQDVVVNPAYGTWNGKLVVAESGSLSDPVSDAAVGASEDPTDPAETAASSSAGVTAVQYCG